METRHVLDAGTPNLFGKYKLGRLIGQGSFAKVYYAKSVVDGTAFAVKVIDKKKLDETTMVPRVVREVSVMHRTNHPNIIRLHELMASKTKIYLVMEFASGGELFKLCRRGPMKESAARRYFHQLLSALHFCHSNGIAHRDLKTHNLLLDRDGTLKVSDFGLSALPEQLKDGLLQTACGTPGYTAPEVVSGRGYDGAKADAWSCGAILFELLAGYVPFNDTNLLVMFSKIRKRQYEFPSWFSPPARRVISRLLDPNPATRMTIEEVMRLQWFRKSYRPTNHNMSYDCPADQFGAQNPFPEDGKSVDLTAMNAFDIISLSSGFDLSGIFEAWKKTKKRFTTVAPPERISEQVVKIGTELGYRVEKRKGGLVRLATTTLVVLVEIQEVVPSLYLVEVKPAGGAAPEFNEIYWQDIKEGLEELVVAWQNDGI
ncbi:CBL-interacting serine/threonine-protein kinase 4 [Aristolochia californica]|uniref:CBL-interacting serine/threonine-protein kinase 4 n=1 Tax=Aristolochia californica TaxID=171875 RepID=UPI0035D75141